MSDDGIVAMLPTEFWGGPWDGQKAWYIPGQSVSVTSRDDNSGYYEFDEPTRKIRWHRYPTTK